MSFTSAGRRYATMRPQQNYNSTVVGLTGIPVLDEGQMHKKLRSLMDVVKGAAPEYLRAVLRIGAFVAISAVFSNCHLGGALRAACRRSERQRDRKGREQAELEGFTHSYHGELPGETVKYPVEHLACLSSPPQL